MKSTATPAPAPAARERQERALDGREPGHAMQCRGQVVLAVTPADSRAFFGGEDHGLIDHRGRPPWQNRAQSTRRVHEVKARAAASASHFRSGLIRTCSRPPTVLVYSLVRH